MPSRTKQLLTGVVVVLATAGPAACSSSGTSSSGGTARSSTAASSTAADPARAGDIAFAQMMIPHHEQAVEMADVAAATPSASADVKSLAATIKQAQNPEITQMKGWLTTWGAPVTPTTSAAGHGSGHGMMDDVDMTALRQAQGADFDRQWLIMMIEHHDGAVTMAQDVLTTTTNPEVRALAESIVSSQQAEITAMQQRLDAIKP